MDNQCAGEAGFGLVDEVRGGASFRNQGERNELSWPAQPGAALYEIARSEQPDFASGCWLNSTDQTYWVDLEDPGVGVVFHYLVRALAPNVGSWGAGSSGIERSLCP